MSFIFMIILTFKNHEYANFYFYLSRLLVTDIKYLQIFIKHHS